MFGFVVSFTDDSHVDIITEKICGQVLDDNAAMASGINFYSYIAISPIRISDIANSS